MKITLIRHGEVAGNSGDVRTFAGARDLELTPRGVLQARAVAAHLQNAEIDAVFASTLQRAYLTAEKIAAFHDLKVERLSGWNEVNYGDWEGLSEAQILENHADLWRARVDDPWEIAPPQGESYKMLWARLEPVWNALLADFDGKNVVVVGHNGSLRVLLCQLLGAPPANARRLQIGNCSITKVNIGDAKTVEGGKLQGPPLVIENINQTSHLAGI